MTSYPPTLDYRRVEPSRGRPSVLFASIPIIAAVIAAVLLVQVIFLMLVFLA
jgi:hypothetical protein